MNRSMARANVERALSGALECRSLQPARSILLEVREISFGFDTRPDFLGPVNLKIGSGECWAVVGPNGAGKSTLLRLMAGLLRPHRGEVLLYQPVVKDVGQAFQPVRAHSHPLDDRLESRSHMKFHLTTDCHANTWNEAAVSKPVRLWDIGSRRRAQHVAFLPQHPPVDLDFTVREVTLMGRFPHRSFGLFESADDERIAEEAMRVTETYRLADRRMGTLSGGEAQRVHLAAALTQQPQLLLLDEPTASLDLHHQLAIFQILRERAYEDGLSVVVVTHDVNLAGRFCSGVVLLDDGRVAAAGEPAEVLTAETLSAVYGVRMLTLQEPESGARWLVPMDSNVPGSQEKTGMGEGSRT